MGPSDNGGAAGAPLDVPRVPSLSKSLSCLSPQASLNKLMETLGQSEPYFVKCIRSNAEKVKRVQTAATLTVLVQISKHFSFPLKFGLF